jgi:hypothetical protein
MVKREKRVPAPPSDLILTPMQTFHGSWYLLRRVTGFCHQWGVRYNMSGLADVDMRDLLQTVRSTNLVVAGLAERVAQPLETLVETVTGGSASRLDVLQGVSKTPRSGGIDLEHTQARCRRLWRPSLSVISAAFMAF